MIAKPFIKAYCLLMKLARYLALKLSMESAHYCQPFPNKFSEKKAIIIYMCYTAANDNIGFPGKFRNFVDQIHFMSIQFRRFGSCTTDLSFDLIFQAFDFAFTPIISKFVSFKFPKNGASSQNGHSI